MRSHSIIVEEAKRLAGILLTLIPAVLIGCSVPRDTFTITISAPESVRAGQTVELTASTSTGPVSGGSWTIQSGSGCGTISTTGAYTAPLVLPKSNSVTISYSNGIQSPAVTIPLLNPVPMIEQVSPSELTSSATPVILTGSGFTPQSTLTSSVSTAQLSFIDSSHVSVTLPGLGNNISAVTFQISNPSPGAANSAILSLPVDLGTLTVIDSDVVPGDTSVTVSYTSGIPAGAILSVGGTQFTTTSTTATTLTASGFIKPWLTGSTTVQLNAADGTGIASLVAPLAAGAVSYDAAARFATQAAWGPRPDVIQHIQQVGFSSFIDEQMATPPNTYPLGINPRRYFLLNPLIAPALLRERVAWGYQTFIPQQSYNDQFVSAPWTITLEKDAFANYRQILLDACSNYAVAELLTLDDNDVPPGSTVPPNQNFARELMQLFSLGIFMLNDDGTPQLDGSGNPIPSYDQATVVSISRAFTGWTATGETGLLGGIYDLYLVDFNAPNRPQENYHDHGEKVLFGNVVLPAGQTMEQDRDQVLDAIFQHQNVPPFVSRLMIQRLVKSNPSPAYIGRISQVFKNDGNGVRGNMAAVIKAILLDPEARAGDTQKASDDGFVQDPIFALISTMSIIGINGIDDQPTYEPAILGENYFRPPTVFSFFSPTYTIPGTSFTSPEFQLITSANLVMRSELLYGISMGTASDFPPGGQWFASRFPTVPDVIDALNHMVYHGMMPQQEMDAMTSYAATQPTEDTKMRSLIFLAINSDNYTVVQ